MTVLTCRSQVTCYFIFLLYKSQNIFFFIRLEKQKLVDYCGILKQCKTSVSLKGIYKYNNNLSQNSYSLICFICNISKFTTLS